MKRDRYNLVRASARLAAGVALAISSTFTWADTVPLFPVAVDFNSPACATYGDFVSCSAQYLNFIQTGSPTGNATYNAVTASPQGALADALVILAGGSAGQSNSGYRTQQGPNIDDPYNPNGQGTLTDYGTRRYNSGTVAAPNLRPCSDPSPDLTGEVTGACSNTTAWDIGIKELTGALTFNGALHDMFIMFDNNQIGEDAGQLLKAWGLVCAYKSALGPTSTAAGATMCFELIDQNGTGNDTSIVDPANGPNGPVTGFQTTKSYGQYEDGNSNNLVRANGAFCVDNVTKQVTVLNSSACGAGQTRIDNNLGTNDTEFITKIPELSLTALAALGFDRLAFQFQFFNNTDGFEDLYILAGAPIILIPEPGTLALAGLAMLGLFAGARRRKA